jgi:hypothetical protein
MLSIASKGFPTAHRPVGAIDSNRLKPEPWAGVRDALMLTGACGARALEPYSKQRPKLAGLSGPVTPFPKAKTALL